MKFVPAFLVSALWAISKVAGLDFQGETQETIRALEKRAATGLTTLIMYDPPLFSYYVQVTIGSADDFVRLRVSQDSYTWVAGELPSNDYCNDTSENYDICVEANFSSTYDPNASTTFKKLATPFYITDDYYFDLVEGSYGQDSFTFGLTKIDNVPFGIGYNYSTPPQLGLGIESSEQVGTSLVRTLLDQKKINLLAYSIYLNDYDTGGSQLSIGSIDTAKYNGNLITFNSSDTTTVPVNFFGYDTGDGAPKVLSRSWNADIQFSSGLLYLPKDAFQTILDDVKAYYDDTYGGYLSNCDYRYGKKSLQFNFQGINIVVPASQWIIPATTVGGFQTKLSDGKTLACTVQLESLVDSWYDAILGAPFVRATYLVHDFTNNQTSFAPANLNTTKSQIEILGIDGVAPFATFPPSASTSASSVGTSPTSNQTGAVTPVIINITYGNGTQTSNLSTGGSKTPVGAIAGGVVGGFALIGLIIGAIFWRRRRRGIPVLDPPQAPMEHLAEYDQAPRYSLPYTGEISGNPLSELSTPKPIAPIELPTAE
ncbi:hypothetical protein TWF694_002081 [Orbilia ellipsospora]|uniref:Peptidase A1 domain-containing protein n=1 Tax=Orbilia ellipsospora TaxID=2528407 RepID=A0AAV9X725_9PEZI